MPKNTFESLAFLPSFSSHNEVKCFFRNYPAAWESFLQFPHNVQQELLNFCIGKNGLKITYDPVFKKVFHPRNHPERLESFLSALLERTVHIIDVLPREGTQMTEKGSFIIMDALVQLSDKSYANIEMQKIGYKFPLARADCYVSDIIMRQYESKKARLGKDFDFRKLQKVYCIILMEQSPTPFLLAGDNYVHKRVPSFDTDIYKNNSGLHEEFFICLDKFHSIVHNITKKSTFLDAWLTFFSATDLNSIQNLIGLFPTFLPIYQEIADFIKKPEELIHMFSEALSIMDRNTERLMVSELQDEVTELKTERNIFKLRLQGKTPAEISKVLSVSPEKINEVLK